MSKAQDSRNKTVNSARNSYGYAGPANDFSNPFAVGEVVCGKYEIESLLGVGSIGFVVSARRIDLGDKVALKFLRPESLVNEELVARFAQEARVAASITSNHVTRVLDVANSANGSPFIVMERLEGRDLSRVMSECGPLPVPLALEYVLEVCEALAAAHARGIVHRDIKPENLFLSELVNGEDIIKVLDFGISKVALAGTVDRERLVRTSVTIGSPVYMSPEQIRESAAVDARTDIWSLGCVLYELLSGSPAFDAHSLMQLCSIILEQSPTPLSALNPQVTPELEAVVWRCLAKDPAERFQNVADLARALGRCAPEGAQIWVERCEFLLASTDRVESGIRQLREPSLARGSSRAPASSRRSLRAVTVATPDAVSRPHKRWTIVAATLGTLALAAAWSLLPITAVGQPRQAGPPPSTQATLNSSSTLPTANSSQAPGAAAVASTPLALTSPALSASSLPTKSPVPKPLPARPVRTPERAPVAAVGTPKATHRFVPTSNDEPDVGY